MPGLRAGASERAKSVSEPPSANVRAKRLMSDFQSL